MAVRLSSARALPDAEHRKRILDRAQVVLTKASELEHSIERFESAQTLRFLREYEALCARGFVTALMESSEQTQGKSNPGSPNRVST